MNYFDKLKQIYTEAFNNSTGLKEGGDINTLPVGLGFSVDKKQDVQIRACNYTTNNDIVATWDMRGFESFSFSVSGNSLNTYRVEASGDLTFWTPVKVIKLRNLDSDYPYVPEVFVPNFNGDDVLFAGETNLPFVRIIRVFNLTTAPNLCALFVINLSSRKIDTRIKPISFYPLSAKTYNPTSVLTGTTTVDAFPIVDANASFNPSSRYVVRSVHFVNSGTASEVQLKDGANVVKWLGFVPANSVVSMIFDPFIEFPAGANSKIQLTVAEAGAKIYTTIQAIKVQA